MDKLNMLLKKIMPQLSQPLWETPRGKGGFLMHAPQIAVVLDVGCGNGSPFWFKSKRPDLYYVGLDVGDYNQVSDANSIADEYVITDPASFAAAITRMGARFDMVVSSHNIEHCADPDGVLRAMISVLKPGGKLYLSTPCEASTGFPRRRGTLNFHDDPSHTSPMDFDGMKEIMLTNGGEIEYETRRYRPIWLMLRGLFFEPWSILKGKVDFNGSTWALYGFESILWMRKR
jgi:SAM-dependent methyltransferase